MRRLVLAAAAITAVSACGDDAERMTDRAAVGDAAVAARAVEPAPALLEPLVGPDAWVMDPAASRLFFSARDGESEFTGRFDQFDAQIRLDPSNLSAASIEAVVALGSVDAGTEDRNDALPKADWFDTSRFPQARFRSNTVERTGEGAYVATGTLFLRGAERPILLPFTLAIDGDRGIADARVAIDRTAFGVGQGDFAGPESVGTEVVVTIHIEADRAAP